MCVCVCVLVQKKHVNYVCKKIQITVFEFNFQINNFSKVGHTVHACAEHRGGGGPLRKTKNVVEE